MNISVIAYTSLLRRYQIDMAKCELMQYFMRTSADAMAGEITTCPECGASYELAKDGDGFILKPESVGEDWGQ